MELQPLETAMLALAKGDFSIRLPEDDPETATFAKAYNAHVEQMTAMHAEINRVSEEMGTLGWFGCQAEVPALEGTWKDMTDNVNVAARNLTIQVRAASMVIEKKLNGETCRLTLEAQGETQKLFDHINRIEERQQPAAV